MHHFGVGHNTVQSQIDGIHGPASKGQENNRHLTETQEKTLCEWVLHAAEMGEPMSKQAGHTKAAELSNTLLEKAVQMGKKHLPAMKWVYGFLDWNSQLVLQCPTGLYAVHASNFNAAVVSWHFNLPGNFLKKNNIPPENMYNMDEKGIQFGGGRKLDGMWYLFLKDQWNCMKRPGTSLELVTTIECVAADSLNLKPCFVFTGKNILHEGYFEEDGVL